MLLLDVIRFKMAMTSIGACNYSVLYRKKKIIRNCKTLINKWMSTLGGDLPRVKVNVDERVEDELLDKISVRTHPGIAKITNTIAIPNNWIETAKTLFPEKNPNLSAAQGENLYNYLSRRKPPVEEDYIKQKAQSLEIECLEKKKIKKKENQSVDDVENDVKNWVKKRLNLTMYNWTAINYNEDKCLAYLRGRSSADYAAVFKIFLEIQSRLPEYQPKSILDFGSGTGTVFWAAHDLWKSHFNEYYAVDTSADMNNLSQAIADQKNPDKQPIIKSVTYRQFLPATHELNYNIVVSAFSLMELPNTKSRLQTIENLWLKTEEFLVIVETGSNAGYELIAEARDFIIKTSEVEAHVFSPCLHNLTCPRLVDKTPCNFEVKYIPMFQIRDTTPKIERYSYVVIQKGKKHENNWPRIVRPVLRRGKHVICRLCTADGQLNEVVVTASKHGRILYKCAKVSNWGDRLPATSEGTTVEDNTTLDDNVTSNNKN